MRIAITTGVTVDWLLTGHERAAPPPTPIPDELRRRATDRGPLGIATAAVLALVRDAPPVAAARLATILDEFRGLVDDIVKDARLRGRVKKAGGGGAR